MTKGTAESYILKRIKVADDHCWNWQLGLGSYGYGLACFNGKTMGAHRFSYIIFKGPIADGLVICHECDNRACVNPAHLEAGTQQKNMSDCMVRYRSARQKLRPDDYDEIVRLYNEDRKTQTIADMYGISAGYVIAIGRGRRIAPHN